MDYENLPSVNGVERPKRFSQSFLQKFDKCHRAGYLQLLHDGGVPSHPAYRGRVFHQVTERVTRTLQEQGEPQIDPVDAKAILQEVLIENPEWTVPAEEMDVLRVMVHHFADHFRLPSVEPLVERKFTMRVGEHTVSGILDLAWVDGDTLHIRDYKASWALPPEDDVSGKDTLTGKRRGAKAFQLIIYALLAADGVPVDAGWKIPAGVNRFDCRFVYPVFTTDDGMVERGLVIERPELIEHRDYLNVVLARVEHAFHTGRWGATPGTHCKGCPAPRECPVPGHLRKVEGISPFERDPKEIAEELMFRKADTDRIHSELKAYGETYGPIPVGSDQVFEGRQVTSTRTNKKARERLAAGEQVSPDELFTPSVSVRWGIYKRRDAE